MRCAKLAAQGLTHRNIAEAVGKKPEQIKALILRGERLLDLASAIPDVPSPD
jgi:DNA-binding CsgD family transcriptional regulator